MTECIYTIYKITNQINKKIYIGFTSKSINVRLKKHFQNAFNDNIKTYLYDSMRKYGKDNFTIESIYESTDRHITHNTKETFYINSYKSNNSSIGYNMTDGGDGGDTFSNNPNKELIRKKLSLATKGKRNPNYGKIGINSPKYGKTYGKKPNISKAKSISVYCDGKIYDSIKEAQKDNDGIKIKYRIDSDNYPTYYRVGSPSGRMNVNAKKKTLIRTTSI